MVVRVRRRLSGTVYSLELNGSRYSVTVIDYTDAERIHAARTNHTEADSLPIYWQVDVQASIRRALPSTARRQQRVPAWLHHARGCGREDV